MYLRVVVSASWRWKPAMGALQTSMIALLLYSASLPTGEAMTCHCSECVDTTVPGHVWGTCSTDGKCYTKVESSTGSAVLRGCVSEADISAVCGGSTMCCHGDRCNGIMSKGRVHSRKLLTEAALTPAESMSMSESEKTIAIITSSVCIVLITAIVSLMLALVFCCLYFYRGNHRTHARADEEVGRVVIGNCCSAIIPQGVTISSLLSSSHPNSSHSPSLSLLVQRAIVKSTSVEDLLERGRFSTLSVGVWRREQVLVKEYSPKQEKMWFAETELHQVPHIHHPHILSFIAADFIHKHGQMRHYLITEYHERGSLADYLRGATLDVAAVVVLAQSAASGLAHLHLEVKGQTLEKPSIVHRNVSSKSFYVKNDGTCCLGDLSLAVKDDGNFLDEVKGKPLGHTLYLSPEVLDGGVVREPLSCDAWKKADVYGLGLVMWEIARRCLIQGCILDAELPFSALASCEHTSVEEMRHLVCSKKLRPTLAEHWSQDEMMQSCVDTLKECWQDHPSRRPSAMAAKNSLDKLLPSIKLTTNKNSKF